MTIITVYLNTKGPLGIRLEERTWPGDGKLRVCIAAIKHTAQSIILARLEPGDWIGDVGFKAPQHVVWNWETVCGYSLEDVHASIQEASKLGKVMALRVTRRPPNEQRQDVIYLPLPEKLETQALFPSKSSSRVGADFQAMDLPACRSVTTPTPAKLEDSIIYTPMDSFDDEFLTTFLEKVDCTKTQNPDDAATCLNILYEYYPDEEKAVEICLQRPRQVKFTSEEEVQFENAITLVGARDFVMVNREMPASSRKTNAGDIVTFYYSEWKYRDSQGPSKAYKEWQKNKEERFSNSQNALCYACSQTDPYGISLTSCSKCSRMFHLECVLPTPLIRLSEESKRMWKCYGCESGEIAGMRKAGVLVEPGRPVGRPKKSIASDVRVKVPSNNDSPVVKRPVGRPPKEPRVVVVPGANGSGISLNSSVSVPLDASMSTGTASTSLKRPVGRPKKQQSVASNGSLLNSSSTQDNNDPQQQRPKRSAATVAAQTWVLESEDPTATSINMISPSENQLQQQLPPPKRPYKKRQTSVVDGKDGSSSPKAKRPRAVHPRMYDTYGRRIQYVKGIPIHPCVLFKVVDEMGGYATITQDKLWQQVRVAMDLPQTTSSSTQLKQVYLEYRTLGEACDPVGMLVEDKGRRRQLLPRRKKEKELMESNKTSLVGDESGLMKMMTSALAEEGEEKEYSGQNVMVGEEDDEGEGETIYYNGPNLIEEEEEGQNVMEEDEDGEEEEDEKEYDDDDDDDQQQIKTDQLQEVLIEKEIEEEEEEEEIDVEEEDLQPTQE